MLWDLSPLLSPRLAVFPGDPPLRREILGDQARGDPVTLSALYATAHLGAHADAPSHYGIHGSSIDQQPLDLYLGPCQVISVPTGPRACLVLDHVRETIRAPRVLFATGTYPDPENFQDDFAGLSVPLVNFLADQGVRLVGIDTPSVDRLEDADLPVHRACFQRNIAILEGLVLEGVPPGVYELIALPLKLAGFDGSPVRAVLRALPGG